MLATPGVGCRVLDFPAVGFGTFFYFRVAVVSDQVELNSNVLRRSGSSQGDDPHGQQDVRERLLAQVLLVNERDQRTWAWLCETVSAEAIEDALLRLAGGRKPYVSNLCKTLGLQPPQALELASRETANARIAAMRSLLLRGRKPNSEGS